MSMHVKETDLMVIYPRARCFDQARYFNQARHLIRRSRRGLTSTLENAVPGLSTQSADVARQFAMERATVAQVVATRQPRLWLWRPTTTIVLTSRERELAESPTARSFGAQGWAIVVRDSGGGPVALGPACLNVSWLTPVKSATSIEQGYLAFCQPLLAAMAGLGVQAYCAPLPGSYCDGRFNLVVAGRKLAGTAQRIYGTAQGSARLSHAVLHVLPGVVRQLAELNRFLVSAKSAEPMSLEHLICVADVNRDASFDAVGAAIQGEFARAIAPSRRQINATLPAN
jgi:lipoate-protein ligase A